MNEDIKVPQDFLYLLPQGRQETYRFIYALISLELFPHWRMRDVPIWIKIGVDSVHYNRCQGETHLKWGEDK